MGQSPWGPGDVYASRRVFQFSVSLFLSESQMSEMSENESHELSHTHFSPLIFFLQNGKNWKTYFIWLRLGILFKLDMYTLQWSNVMKRILFTQKMCMLLLKFSYLSMKMQTLGPCFASVCMCMSRIWCILVFMGATSTKVSCTARLVFKSYGLKNLTVT